MKNPSREARQLRAALLRAASHPLARALDAALAQARQEAIDEEWDFLREILPEWDYQAICETRGRKP